MEHVGILKFDEKNKVHKKLSALSKSLHRLKSHGQTAAMEELEEDIDGSVNELFGIGKPQIYHK